MRVLLVTLGIVIAGATVAVMLRGGGDSPTPSGIVLISIDTLRADHVSAYGYALPTTPNIDASVARRGHRFAHAYAPVAKTLPSHTTMMTGLHPRQLGVMHNRLVVPSEAETLAETLSARGYSTAAFVSSVVLHQRFGLAQGFSTYVDVEEHQIERLGAETVERANAWVSTVGERPFFLFVHLFDPHRPYHAPPEFRAAWSAPGVPLPREVGFLKQPQAVTAEVVAQVVAAYDAEIAYADHQVGRLLSHVEQAGLGRRTVIVVVGDHGESMDELLIRYGYAFDHGEFLHAHQLRVPLIVLVPGGDEGIVHQQPVSLIDLAPTLLDLLGVPLPSRMTGRSLLPLMEEKSVTPSPVFSELEGRRGRARRWPPELRAGAQSLVLRNWHLMRAGRLPPELYDLERDPGENANVADAQREVTAELSNRLEKAAEVARRHLAVARPDDDPAVAERLRALGYTD
jgi:choline-sulfatase